MNRMNVFVIFFLLICTPFLAAENNAQINLGLIEYIDRVLEYSSELDAAAQEFEHKRERLESVRIVSGSNLEIREAQNALEVQTLRLSEIRASLIVEAAGAYFSFLQTERGLNSARQMLDIKKEIAAATESRWKEGVKTEVEFLEDNLAKLNSEISLLSTENAYEKSRRILLRKIGVDAAGNNAIVLSGYDFQDTNSSLTYTDCIREAETVSSVYVDALYKAEFRARNYQILLNLNAPGREKETSLQEKEAAEISLRTQREILEEQTWDILDRCTVLSMTKAVGDRQLEIATIQWDARQTQFAFGIIQPVDLELYRLTYGNEVAAAKKKQEDLFIHNLKVRSFMGADPLDLISTLK